MTALIRSLRTYTAARIGLQTSGASLATREVLQLSRDHALARDAVHATFDTPPLVSSLQTRGHPVCEVHSQAADRATYLRRPDLGRQLAPAAALLSTTVPWPTRPPVAIVIADGLAAAAPSAHSLPLLRELVALAPNRWGGTPVVVAHQARVALGDAVGARLQAQLVLVLIGERPGLSAHDSLGAYLTYAPQPSCTDADRNCVSNIRPEGLGYAEAACRLHWLVEAALRGGLSGVRLKDESDAARLHIAAPAANIQP